MRSRNRAVHADLVERVTVPEVLDWWGAERVINVVFARVVVFDDVLVARNSDARFWNIDDRVQDCSTRRNAKPDADTCRYISTAAVDPALRRLSMMITSRPSGPRR